MFPLLRALFPSPPSLVGVLPRPPSLVGVFPLPPSLAAVLPPFRSRTKIFERIQFVFCFVTFQFQITLNSVLVSENTKFSFSFETIQR
ncbi:hypothetical protein ACOSQ3_010981 [Xanthoceras sorbifolium]